MYNRSRIKSLYQKISIQFNLAPIFSLIQLTIEKEKIETIYKHLREEILYLLPQEHGEEICLHGEEPSVTFIDHLLQDETAVKGTQKAYKVEESTRF